MTFVAVKEVPGRTAQKNLRGYLDEFMRMNVKIVRVDFNEKEYKHAGACCGSLHNAVKRGAYPINVVKNGDEVYLVRRDMD